ncbi:MAG: DNA polymerase I [Lachnospiraceae bacterium]|nr:DNA polymerase I [Lachnospiraceae bacterium]
MKKLVLIDGHSILNRAFYGLPELSNAEGLHTNAIYGFLNIMFKILEEEKPDYLAVAFDVHAPTFRHKMYDAYKGTRKPMPEELREQVPVMKEVLKAMHVVIMEQAGLEADDILGTLAKKAERDGMAVSLVSGDRDLLQIASDKIKIRIPKTKRNGTEIEDYYAADVQAAYQMTPEQFIDLKALMGDTADNIPGVPKVGEKTATGLIVEYGSLDQLYEHVEKVSKNAIRTSLIENKELAYLSKTLATIRIDCDLQLDYEAAKAEGFYTPEAYALFKRLEFKNFLGRFDQAVSTGESVKLEVQKIEDLQSFRDLIGKISGHTKRIGLRLMQEQNKLYGVAISLSERENYVFLPVHDQETMGQLSLFDAPRKTVDETEAVKRLLVELSAHVHLATFDIKKQYDFLSQDSTERYFDILIGAYLLNPLKNDHEIDTIASEHLGMTVKGTTEVFGKHTLPQVLESEPQKAIDFYAQGAYVALAAAGVIEEKLQQAQMDRLMREIEMPLSLVLYDMEKEGIEVRREELKTYGDALVSRIDELEGAICEAAGEKFNINSPKQLGEVLFEKLQLPGGKKTKTGYSTAADVLDKLAGEYPIVKDILEYRALTKLKSTYADGLAVYIGEDRRIHTNFNQTITATGRISSTEPNLQNIPTRTELGRQLRKVFVPKEGYVFLDADYSQIELRVLAHMSGDEQLIEAYRMDEDIHRITASKVFHVPLKEVTSLQRRNAKAVNFGIVYGISSFGLSQDLSISRKEAAAYIEQYFATYPGIKGFLDGLVSSAKETGYAVTMFRRRRPVPELASSNFMQRSFGERVAMNSPIQGTAADIIKIAMIRVWEALRQSGLKSRLILQVHDELLIETAQDEVEQVQKILVDHMKTAADLKVSLEVDVHSGASWYEAK